MRACGPASVNTPHHTLKNGPDHATAQAQAQRSTAQLGGYRPLRGHPLQMRQPVPVIHLIKMTGVAEALAN